MNEQLRADDHILLLDIPSVRELQNMARILMRGSIVVLGSADGVEAARQAMADFDNVLFVDAAPDRIPWREAYFTKVIVPPHFEPLLPQISAEVHRVLRADGVIVRATESG